VKTAEIDDTDCSSIR